VRRRPAGADSFVKLRRSLDEHLELGRLTWDEFAMFVWLCIKASHRTGTVRTSWPMLALQTRLSTNRVEQICRGLRRKGYVWYPAHRGSRGRLSEVAIDKYPTADGGYTDLSARFGDTGLATGPGAEAPAEAARTRASGEPASPVPPRGGRTDLGRRRPLACGSATELRPETDAESRGSPPGRLRRDRERERDRDGDARVPRARLPGARPGQDPPGGEDVSSPVAIRDVLARQPWWPATSDRRPADPESPTRATPARPEVDGGGAR
jgi:hypothetical protein